MQQHQSVPYAGFVSDVKKTYSKEYLKAQHALGVNVRSYKEWDKSDLITLYGSYFGRVIFDHLVHLVREARREEAAQQENPTQTAYHFAQRDLNDLAPQGMNWKHYDRLVTEAAAEIKNVSFKITNDLAKLFRTPAEDDFDLQIALAQLDASHVMHSSETPAVTLAAPLAHRA